MNIFSRVMAGMGNWPRRIGGALGLCLTWAAGWAAAGLCIGAASVLLPFLPWEVFFRVFDAPLPTLGMPGFIGGAIFSAVIRLAERGGSSEELPLGRFAAWGALAGILLSLIPVVMVAAGLAQLGRPGLSLWHITFVISVPLTLLGAGSGLGSLLLARIARPWKTALANLLADRE